MATYKFEVACAADSLLSRDMIVNTFHLDDHGVTTDPDGLCEDAAAVWAGLYGNRQITVKAYDTGNPPNFPVGEHTINTGVITPSSSGPREVALCLSYYGERNLPKTRGRIYFCPAIMSALSASTVRPGQGHRDRLLDMADSISGLGGLDVDWIYWSQADGSHGPVKHAWVDDEWDTMRSRGLRATTRSVRDVSG